MKVRRLIIIAGLFLAACSAEARQKPKLPEIVFEWDAPIILGRGGYTRVLRLSDERLMCSYTHYGNGYACYSLDNGYSWGEPSIIMNKYEWSNENGSTVVGMHNPETMQLSTSNPYYPKRIFYIVNLRPSDKKSSVHPYGIAYVTSDDNGETWSSIKTIFLSEQWDKDVLKGCWEPYLMELPDGNIQMYFADETPYYKQGDKYQNISVMESSDGGDTWSEPRIVCYTPMFRDGMPVTMIYNGKIYLSIESNHVNVRLRPQILYTSLEDNWKETVGEYSKYRFNPFLVSRDSPDFVSGAPYLVQTKNFFVLSYQTSENADIKIRTQRIMEVQACLKSEMKKDKFHTMRGASRPIDVDPRSSHVMWNSLSPLSGDEIMACCQYNGKVALVRGRIKTK